MLSPYFDVYILRWVPFVLGVNCTCLNILHDAMPSAVAVSNSVIRMEHDMRDVFSYTPHLANSPNRRRSYYRQYD